jgi:hypothetical protein
MRTYGYEFDDFEYANWFQGYLAHKENVSKDRYSQAIAQRRQIRPLYFPAWRQSQSGLWALSRCVSG